MDNKPKDKSVPTKRKKKTRVSFSAEINPLKKILEAKLTEETKEDKKKTVKPISTEKLEKYSRGEGVRLEGIKTWTEKIKITDKERERNKAVKRLVRQEILLPEVPGLLEAEPGETTTQVKQSELVRLSDPLAASKRFDLFLRENGSYRLSFTRNGRFGLIGSERGHLAALDWHTKRLYCEFHVRESIHDITWLHQETLFAVAQRKWVYIYDNQGIEMHCLKQLNEIVKLEFLPYHFLLGSVSGTGCISWLDVSVGEIVSLFRTGVTSTASCISQHPGNAHLAVAGSNGVVSFWSPNSNKAVISKLCHNQPITAITFEQNGLHYATTGTDKLLRVWDARNLQGPLQETRLKCSTIRNMSYSQQGLLAFATAGDSSAVQVLTRTHEPYMRHNAPSSVSHLLFCPWEDVVAIGHSAGVSSILIPGAGHANFDALEANPFQSKAQRREAEVKALLNKIPADLISWDPRELEKVHQPSLTSIVEAKKKLNHIRPPKIHVKVRKRTGKAGGTILKRKRIIKEQLRKEHIQMTKELKSAASKTLDDNTKKTKAKKSNEKRIPSALARFANQKPKTKSNV